MSTVRRAIASTAVCLIKNAFAGEYSPGSHLRVAGFQRDEVSEMVALLTGWAPWEGHTANLLVTTKEPWEGLPSAAIVMSGEVTATGLRNRTEPVVYFEQDAYADRQGLKKVWRITDRDVLEADCPTGTARGLLEGELWRQTRADPIPEVLSTVFDQVWSSFAPKKGEIDVRTWARFVDEVCRAVPSVVTTQEAWNKVGELLRVLQIFPDDLLVEASPTERSRRLRRNWRSSRFVTESADEAALDELRERLEAVTLEEPSGDATPPTLAAQLKERFKRLLGSSRDPERLGLWFRYWEQIENRKSKKKGLGQQVADQITRRAPERRDELDALDVIEGLDAREQEAAIRFLEAVPPTTRPPLSSLLTPALLRAVMKVADPSQKVTKQPLLKILREVQQMVQERLAEKSEPGQIRLERMARGTSSQVADEASAALFAFVYGPTLRSIEDNVKGGPITFACDKELTDAAAFEAIRARLDKEDVRDDDEVEELGWDPIRLQLRWTDDTAGRVSFEWRARDLPGLAMLARVVSKPDMGMWTGAEGHSFDDWVEGAFDQGSLDGETASSEIAKELPSAWTSRTNYLSAIAERGLVPEDLDLYVRDWAEALDHLRCNHRPEGNPDPLVSEFLRLDTWDGHDGSLAILAHHPLRLRWIAAHLREMQTLITRSLRGALKLNVVNEGIFFDRLERASPRAHPPVLVLDQQQYVAVRESDWHEIFHVARDTKGLRRDWLAELDDHAIDSAAELIGKYVEAYPHKADGLHLLTLVRPGSSGSIVRALKAVRSALSKLGGKRLELVLSVFAPVEELIRFERALQVFDSDDRRAESEFPAIRVQWHQWDSDQDVLPDLGPVSSDIDVALIRVQLT